MTLRMFLQGLIPMYPFIMGKLNANSSDVGIYLSLSYVFLFLGTYLTGIIVPKYVKPKNLLLSTVLPMSFALMALGFTNDLWLFDTFGCALNFFIGMHVCSNNILMGYYSTEKSVSKNFSTLSFSSLLATVFGGFLVGPLLAWLGYKYSFAVFGGGVLLFSLLLIPIPKPEISQLDSERKKFRVDKNLWLLLVSTFLVSLLLYGFKMGISIMLKRRNWRVSDISIMMALGSSFALPITIWWGKISKYSNSKMLLIISVLCGFAGYFTLFEVGIYFLGLIGFACISVVAYTISIPLMNLLFGWYNRWSLPKAQALISSAVYISAIVGFLVNGYAMQHYSERTCIITGLMISVAALIPLLLIKFERK